jgi:uncharacterized protein
MNARNNTLVGILSGALLVAAIAVAGMVGFLLSRPAAVSAQGSGIGGLRQITVIGTGESRARPDTAIIQIGVETTGANTQEALAQNNTQAQALIDKLAELGIEKKDIQTSNFSIYANYENDGRTITGYTVSNMVTVTVRQLDSAGALLDQAVAVGANRVYGINFNVAEPSALLNQARESAVANARANAELLAKAAGATVGQVLVVTENVGAASPIPMPRMMDEAQAAGSAVPVQAGEQSYSAQVQVTFELR